jgi:hypothetical protein
MKGHPRAALGAALAVYGALLLLARGLLGNGGFSGPAEVLIALLPVPAAVAALIVIISQVRSLDELQQRIRLVALAVSFSGTLLITFSWGFLEGVGIEPLGGFAVFGILVALYLAGIAWAGTRYR